MRNVRDGSQAVGRELAVPLLADQRGYQTAVSRVRGDALGGEGLSR